MLACRGLEQSHCLEVRETCEVKVDSLVGLEGVLVPLLMQLGISPEYAQAAYRVGDSTTNIITPLMPYFPLVVVFCDWTNRAR